MTKKKKSPPEPSVKDCGCIDKLNELLEPKNTGIQLGMTLNFETGEQGDCLQVVTYKLDSKARGKAVSMMAAYCPFCGRRYWGKKSFLYVESIEGGSKEIFFTEANELHQLRGWGTDQCKESDDPLKAFILNARVGESHGHRLGICIRLQDVVS